MRVSVNVLIAAGMALAAVPALADKPAAPDAQLLARGKLIFMRCAACHSVAPGAPAKVGPNLNGVVGRPSAVMPGFNYSSALKAAKLTWNEATLDTWLRRPTGLVPGTSMVFAGLPSADDRKAVIAYLKKPAR